MPPLNQERQIQDGKQDPKAESYVGKDVTNSGITDVNLEKATTTPEETTPPARPSGDSGFRPKDFKGPSSPPSVQGPTGNPPNY